MKKTTYKAISSEQYFIGMLDQMYRGEEGMIFKVDDKDYFVGEGRAQIDWPNVVLKKIRVLARIQDSPHPEVPDTILIDKIEDGME